jgi:tRNA(His) 5'-end guanylyltransferase
MSKDELGDRMKGHEAIETSRKFDSTFPVYARIDGRSFSKFTRKMDRPFDLRMTQAMVETTRWLVDHTNAAIGYVQSDEISLVWSDTWDGGTKLFFDGKIQKSCSVLASMAAAKFAVELQTQFGDLSASCPHFDCRIIQMPSRVEAANMLLWRSLDCTKNAISMAARSFFSHKALQGKNSAEMVEMIQDLGWDMNSYPTSFTRGTWLQRVTKELTLTDVDIAKIPKKHRPPLGTVVQRSSVEIIDMPKFIDVANREAVIFKQATPIQKLP